MAGRLSGDGQSAAGPTRERRNRGHGSHRTHRGVEHGLHVLADRARCRDRRRCGPAVQRRSGRVEQASPALLLDPDEEPPMRNWRRLRDREDGGYAMVLVLGIGLVLTALAMLAAGKGVAAIQGSASHATFAQNLDVAEAGIDQIGARVQATNGSYAYCPTSATVTCTLTAQVRTRGFATRAEERQWAATTLRKLAAENSSLLVTTRGGQYLAIKPVGLNTIYSMSWVPSYARATRQRLLKSEYVFSTFRTSAALLANGDVSCCASYDFDLTGDMAPTSMIPVHSNGSLTGSVSATSGVLQATASGACSAPCT